MKMVLMTVTLLLSQSLVDAKHMTHKPTFLLSYKDRRCFQEMFYLGSTLELYAELVEPESLRNEFVKDAEKDGVHYYVIAPNKSLLTEGILGNKASSSYVSYNYLVDHPKNEGYYMVCFNPTDSLFYNAADASKEGNTPMFGRIF